MTDESSGVPRLVAAEADPGAQELLTLLLDKWMDSLRRLGFPNPDHVDVPAAIELALPDGSNKITLNKPQRSFEHRDPVFRHDLRYSNTIRASYSASGLDHILHVSSDCEPHVTASRGGIPAFAVLTAPELMQLILDGEVASN